MNREQVIQLSFFGLLALMGYELYRLLYPFLAPVIWALIIGFMVHPLFKATAQVVRDRSLSALLTVFATALGVVLPALWLAELLTGQAHLLYLAIASASRNGTPTRVASMLVSSSTGKALLAFAARHGIDLQQEASRLALEAARSASDFVVTNLTGVARNLVHFTIDFGVMLLTLFYVLRDGEIYFATLQAFTPLRADDREAVFGAVTGTLSAVMRGVLLTALAQGVLLGLALAMFGVPFWAFLSALAAICSILPVGGAALVWMPVVIYLKFQSGWSAALILLAWAAVWGFIMDHLVKPIAIGRGTGLPTPALFLGIAGGLEAYGIVGLFAGPAVIAVLAALLRAYRRTYGLDSSAMD